MKLFGRKLFRHKETTEVVELYDFARHGILKEVTFIGTADIDLAAISGDDEITDEYLNRVAENNAKARAGTSKTPKEVYLLKSLNDDQYQIKLDPSYLKKTISSLERKAKILPSENVQHQPGMLVIGNGDGVNSREAVLAMAERLNNRYNYHSPILDADFPNKKFSDFYEQFAYTSTAKINDVLATATNLRAGRSEKFIPELPDEAIDIIEEYTRFTLKLCGKKPVFYIIADKKDFGEVDRQRDPILLAQSPFAFSWQVLGAWDDEVQYLGDL